jgi:penicillin amidase
MIIDETTLHAALSDTRGTRILPGLRDDVIVRRDEWGIPHIKAGTAGDAHFALGFVHAQDRLFQMELTRRRALGRAAEWLGPEAAEGDALCRRLGMEAACRRDYAALGDEARAMLDRYAAGVNAFLALNPPLPVEYALLGAAPEPWEGWHPIAVMRRLGLLMGSVWFKLARILALPIVGAENAAKLRYDDGEAELLCIPPGATGARMAADLVTLRPAIAALLAAMGSDETGGGSNNWAVGPGRSASGRPILAGDPHRVFEIPGMYAQHHLACDEWDAIGLTVPGVPAFPHYMHNGRVACCVTHAFVDIHDLFLERFEDGACLFRGGREPLRSRTETIRVRGEADRVITVAETRHGPVVAGDPSSGAALVLRSVQFADTDLSFDCLPRMLRAGSVPELFEATRGWGLIDHNLVAGDVQGRIGHRVRALVPRRPRANGWFAVPGWTGEGEWDGYIPHDAMPEVIDPEGGTIVTANNRIVADGEPYLCTDCHPPYRAARIAALLGATARFGVEDAAAIHADVLSPNAPLFQARLRALPPPRDPKAAALREELLGWDGRMEAGSVAAGHYNALRRAMTAILVRRSGLAGIAAHPWAAVPPSVSAAGNLWWVLPTLLRNDDAAMLNGWGWDDVLQAALEEAAAAPAASWGEAHRPSFRHPLSGLFADAASLLDPPSMPLGGDGDTVMAIGLAPAAGPAASYGALCRYVIDVGGWENSRWAVFHGASGQPGSPHYADQATDWAACRMVPMRYDWSQIEQAATATQQLRPAAT